MNKRPALDQPGMVDPECPLEGNMKVKMILPALTEAKSPFCRPIKYSLFPPLGLATLAGYLSDKDEVTHPGRACRDAGPGR